MSASPKVTAPWTAQQVRALNEWQTSEMFHPFTCASGDTLRATESGWVCPHCDYTQAWAHEFMVVQGLAYWTNKAAGWEGKLLCDKHEDLTHRTKDRSFCKATCACGASRYVDDLDHSEGDAHDHL